MKNFPGHVSDSLPAEQPSSPSQGEHAEASVLTSGLSAAEVQDLVENRLASLFHLSNAEHPVQLALRQLCAARLSKKMKSSL